MTSKQVFQGTLIILLTLLCAYILLISARILIVLLTAIVIASAVRPLVVWLTRFRMPQGAAILLVYILLAGMILLLSVAVIPPVLNQVAGYIENDWRLANRIIEAQRWVEQTISDVTDSDVSLVAPEEIRSAVSDFARQFQRFVPSILDDIGTALGEGVLIFVMGAYWLTSHHKATAFVTQLFPPQKQERIEAMLNEIETTMGSYVRGISLLAGAIGILTVVTFLLMNVPNALLLGLIIGISSVIPMIGGLIGGILAVLITLVAAPRYILTVFVVFFITQQLVIYYLAPRIMANQVGLDSLLVLVYTAVGFVMFGVVGALIAVPIMSTVHLLLVEVVIKPYKAQMERDNHAKSPLIIQPFLPPDEDIVFIEPMREQSSESI